jgi:hypothetical protein
MLRERSNGDRQVIAHHEAGHAAVARDLGRPVAVVRQHVGATARGCPLGITAASMRFKPFFQALRDLGYVDGQTITSTTSPRTTRASAFPFSPPCLRLGHHRRIHHPRC